MLSIKDYHNLLEYQAPSRSVVSLYLEFDRPAACGRNLKTLLKERLSKDPLLQGLPRDLERIGSFVEGEFNPERRQSLAVISSVTHGLWQATPLPQAVKSQVRVGDRPYLAPLSNLLDQYRRFGIALVGAEEARFLEVHLEDVAEFPQAEAAPGGPSPGPADPYDLHAHLKAAADRLMDLHRRRGFDRLIIGTAAKLEPLIVSHLHTVLQENLIVDHGLGPRTPTEAVLQAVLTGEREARKVRESVLVARLLDAVRSGGLGVAGLEETLRALQQGLVRKLLVRDGFAKMGRLCGGCGYLSLEGKRCVACYLPSEPVFNLIPEMEQRALDQGCEVFRVLHDEHLDNVGSIGAELRTKPAEAKQAPAGPREARARQAAEHPR